MKETWFREEMDGEEGNGECHMYLCMKMIMGKVGHTDSCVKCVFAEDKFHEFGKKIKLLLQGLVHG